MNPLKEAICRRCGARIEWRHGNWYDVLDRAWCALTQDRVHQPMGGK